MQALLNGLASGFAIALFAAAFQIVYLPTRIFYVGLAGIYTLAPFLALSFSGWMPWSVALLLASVAGATLSVICEVVIHRPLARTGASDGAHLISSLGVYVLLSQLVQGVWGNQTQSLGLPSDSALRMGDALLTQGQVTTILISLLLLGLLGLALRLTRIGTRLRALADNPKRFALLGFNVATHRMIAFGVAGAFAAAASLLSAYDIGFDPHRGLPALLVGVVAVIAGGRSSFAAPVAAALILGVLQAQVRWNGSSSWVDATTFAILAACLLFVPTGLFVRRTRIEV
jgi:branched-subunit amino acid ABC-type transport system permease component